jgi:hypothetical protein
MQAGVCEIQSAINREKKHTEASPSVYSSADEILSFKCASKRVVKTMSDKKPKKALTQKERANFDRLLLEAIDETLSCLGESSKTEVYRHLETAFNIKKEEIPNRIDDFSKALESLFGLGVRVLEIMFMKNLYAKVKVVCEGASFKWVVPEMTFREYVDLMKQRFEEASKRQEVGIFINGSEEKQICS